MRLFYVVLAAVVASSSAVQAKDRSKTPPVVALAPVEGLRGTTGLRRVEMLLSEALSKGDSWRTVTAADLRKTIRGKRRLDLGSCDGKADCLAKLGTLVGAGYVLHAEVAALAKAQVVYLKLVQVATATELRSTTLSLGAEGHEQGAWASVMRLIAPSQYVGSLQVASNVQGAVIFLDGRKIATTPAKAVSVSVGSHAMRVTHPEYQDFVQFVDVDFEQKTEVEVTLHPLAGVERALSNRVVSPNQAGEFVRYTKRPWYKRWYVLAGGTAAAIVVTAVVTTVVSSGVDADEHLVR